MTHMMYEDTTAVSLLYYVYDGSGSKLMNSTTIHIDIDPKSRDRS